MVNVNPIINSHKKFNVMKNLKYFFFAVLSMVFFFTSCTDDKITNDDLLNTVDQHKHDERCGHEWHMAQILNDPIKKAAHEEKMEQFQKYSEQVIDSRALCSDPVVLPIAVHYQGVSNPNVSCLISLAQSQVAVLNNDFQGTNSDLSEFTGASSYFPGIGYGETCMKFVLADQNHPSGYGLSNGDLAVTVNKTNGDFDSNWSGYINIFVNDAGGNLGYSPLGGNGNGDGVVIARTAFGSGTGCGSVSPSAPYNLGRTLVHELGHFLLLDHIWGNGGCGSDDAVSDTPIQNDSRYDCPNLGVTSCGSNDLFLNYMDYVNDACMVMFTSGQSARMENYVNSSLSNVVNNASNVINGSGGGGGGGGGGGTGGTTCDNISSVSVQNINNTKVKLSWSAISDAIYYRVAYRKQGTSQWTVRTTTGLSRTLTGLLAGTTYQYRTRVKCPSGWTAYSSLSTFTTTGGNGGGTGGTGCQDTEAEIRIKLDDYGSETSFELVDENGTTVKTGGPYADGQRNTVKKTDLCLADGCYTLFIDDSYGDGICCSYGNGKVWVRDQNNQTVAFSNGNFGSYVALEFCADNGNLTFRSEQSDEASSNLAAKSPVGGN